MSIATADAAPESKLTRNIPIESIHVDGKNGSTRTSGPQFEEFVEDVRQHGVLSAILVRAMGVKSSVGNEWHLIAGHRRLAAAKRIGQVEIPAVVSTLPPEHDEELRLVENLHRRDLHPIEEAEGYARLLGKGEAKDVARIAQKIGRSPTYVYDRLKLANLSPDAKRLFLEGRIELGHAIILARLPAAEQKRALDPDPQQRKAALFEHEHTLFTDEETERAARQSEKDPWAGMKTRTAPELQGWVDRNVRAKPDDVDPMLFPVTAEELGHAQKVIPITREYHLTDSAKSAKERTFGPMSWKRADGQHGTKTCAFGATGFVVAGPGRNESFTICTAKEKCTIHWAAHVKAKAKKAATKEKRAARPGVDPKKEAERAALQQKKERARVQSREDSDKQILEASLAAAAKMTYAELVRIIVANYVVRFNRETKSAVTLAKADDATLRRLLAFQKLENDWQRNFAKALGVDAGAIVKKAEADAMAALEPKPAASGSAQKKASATKTPRGARPRKHGVIAKPYKKKGARSR